MISRLRFGLVAIALSTGGCGEVFSPTGSVRYSRAKLDEALAGKPTLQGKVVSAVDKAFGARPTEIKVPAGTGLPLGGRYLASRIGSADPNAAARPVAYRKDGALVEQAGGYALYRRHCLHCHGVTGDGNGPTANYLFPRPRDYRPGVFKFTSTGDKPTRADLKKTLVHGLHGTSMPAFEALMTNDEIEQVVDYVIFLSMRGQLEHQLIQEVKDLEDNDTSALPDDIVKEDLQIILDGWKLAEEKVGIPEAPRTPSTPESIRRGRDLFLGKNNLQCYGCHGPRGLGNGANFVEPEFTEYVLFGPDSPFNTEAGPAAQERRVESYIEGKLHALQGRDKAKYEAQKTALKDLWVKGSLDDWGNPIRPSNLTKGVYKGGRRPIDLYWRIAKGINGAKMPSHANLSAPEIWDIVNFVLALPHDPALLDGATPVASPPARVASRE